VLNRPLMRVPTCPYPTVCLKIGVMLPTPGCCAGDHSCASGESRHEEQRCIIWPGHRTCWRSQPFGPRYSRPPFLPASQGGTGLAMLLILDVGTREKLSWPFYFGFRGCGQNLLLPANILFLPVFCIIGKMLWITKGLRSCKKRPTALFFISPVSCSLCRIDRNPKLHPVSRA